MNSFVSISGSKTMCEKDEDQKKEEEISCNIKQKNDERTYFLFLLFDV